MSDRIITRILQATFIVAILLMGYAVITRHYEMSSSNEDLIDALQDSLHQYHNERGEWVAERLVMQGDIETIKLVLGDSLSRLQEALDKQTESATYWKGITTGRLSGRTTVVYDSLRDTFHHNILMTEYVELLPTYNAQLDDEWAHIEVTAGHDSTEVFYQIRNEFVTTQEWSSHGFLKRPELVVTVTNLNPNTFTNEVVSVRAAAPKKKLHQKAWFWGLIGLGTGFLIAN